MNLDLYPSVILTRTIWYKVNKVPCSKT